MNKIDVVITWVDNNDPQWINDKKKYEKSNAYQDSTENRFKDYGMLKYWFRSVEENMPWINKVFFVTYGHIPTWLNVRCDKLRIVKHSEFIDRKYLPTFNSCAIEMNLHRIKDLSEQFIYFNDDMFINRKIKEDFFFEASRPKDYYIVAPLLFTNDLACNIKFNSNKLALRYASNDYHKKATSPKNGIKMASRNALAIKIFGKNIGFRSRHIPTPYLKSIYTKAALLENEVVSQTSNHRFRSGSDISQWYFQYYQLATGISLPKNPAETAYYTLQKDIDLILRNIQKPKKTLVCINDANGKVNEEDVSRIIAVFEQRYPEKSRFEK